MITIELDSCGESAADISEAGTARLISRLLDRCEAENIRDVALRLPAIASKNLEAAIRPLLGRPFRFSAWFRSSPPAELAELFVAAGHRITIATTATPDGSALHSLLKSQAYTLGAPWQVSLFIALPAPLSGFAEGLDGVTPRTGTNITLGLAWASPEAGPSPITSPAEKEWAKVLPDMATWWTGQGVTIHLACGLPLCLFSTEQLGELALSKVRHPLAACTPGLVVTLDGRVRACPRLPVSGWVSMPTGVSLKELANQLIGNTSFFAAFCNRAGEQSCRSLATGACGGGCMAHNALIWHGDGVGIASRNVADEPSAPKTEIQPPDLHNSVVEDSLQPNQKRSASDVATV
jgi:hypothetical protein